MNAKRYLPTLALSLIIVGCAGSNSPAKDDGDNNDNPQLEGTPGEVQAIVEGNSIDPTLANLNLPSLPSVSDATGTVNGIDANGDGVRDELEVLVYQAIVLTDGSSTENYQAILDVLKMIQPVDPVVDNSIDEQTITCAYLDLPKSAVTNLSLDLLFDLVLDTPERIDAYESALVPAVNNLGAESCS